MKKITTPAINLLIKVSVAFWIASSFDAITAFPKSIIPNTISKIGITILNTIKILPTNCQTGADWLQNASAINIYNLSFFNYKYITIFLMFRQVFSTYLLNKCITYIFFYLFESFLILSRILLTSSDNCSLNILLSFFRRLYV